MNILYDHQIFIDQIHGGPSRYFIKIAEEILKKENLRICAPLNVNEYLKYLPSENVVGLNLNNIYFEKLPFGIKRLIKQSLINKINIFFLNNLIKNFKPNLIHKTNYDNYKTKLPVIITVYDLIHEKFSRLYGNDKDYRPKKNALERADQIICISENTRNDLHNYYDLRNKKIKVIYLGCELNKNLQSDQIFQLKENKFLLYVGKRQGYKNFSNFIKAFSISEKLKKEYKIYCFGGGRFTKMELQLFKEYKIKSDLIQYFEGDDNILVHLYKNANALVYPSRYEGFGLPILEAMSFDCPVICSNNSSIPEIGGDAVKYFNPNSIEDIESAICETVFSTDNVQKLKKLGQLRVKLFNWKKCASETLSLYKELI